MAEPRRDEGFTLVEIIVALGIFLLVTMALLPQMVAGIRSVTTADNETMLKGVLQQEVDRLRGLPYRVSLGTGGAGTDEDVDLLDLYYPNVSHVAPSTLGCDGAHGYATPEASWAGYVATAARCDYEPSSGAFYRTVSAITDPRLGEVTIVRDVQFLTGGTAGSPTATATAPAATYDSDHATTNYPPAPQVGVTVTALFDDGGETRARSLYTQIAKHDVGPTLVRTSVDVDAVEITSVSQAGAAMTLSAGVVGLDSSVGDITSAAANLTGVAARMSTGDPTSSQFGYGATATIAAPPSAETLSTTPDTPDWGAGGCAEALCWGASEVGSDTGAGVVADGGLPQAGTAASQLRASVTDPGAAALTFDNGGTADDAFTISDRVVRLLGAAPGAPTVPDATVCPLGVSAGARLSGSGYLSTSMHDGSDTVRDTTACGSARSAAVGILPIGDWAPEGIVRVTLNRAYAWCQVTDGTPTGDAALSASVEISDGDGGYQPAIDASSLDLATVIPGRQALSHYLQGWTVGTTSVTTASSKVTVTMPGLVVTTQPTRKLATDPATPDEDSAVVVTLGAVSCSSETTS